MEENQNTKNIEEEFQYNHRAVVGSLRNPITFLLGTGNVAVSPCTSARLEKFQMLHLHPAKGDELREHNLNDS
jgi:hypothetical protein